MKKIEAIIREEKMQEVLDALIAAEITGITVYQVMGCGTQRGCVGVVRGQKIYTQLLPKIKLEIAVSSEEWKEKTIQTIREVARTGEFGDGKIFAYAITDAVKIRTGESGYDALQSSDEG